jgi:hypothetical protein
VRNLSGVDAAEALYGDWFSYNKTARGAIFARDHVRVTDLKSMMALMRYNNYKADPLSSQLGTCAYRGWTNCTPPYTGKHHLMQ